MLVVVIVSTAPSQPPSVLMDERWLIRRHSVRVFRVLVAKEEFEVFALFNLLFVELLWVDLFDDFVHFVDKADELF